MKYVQTIELHEPFADACLRVEAAFKEQGFGVLTTIDVDEVLQEKLNKAMPSYRIYGVCNPVLADRALTADPEVGVMLPCSVVVRAHAKEATAVSILSPAVIREMGPLPEVEQVMADAVTRISAAVAALAPTP